MKAEQHGSTGPTEEFNAERFVEVYEHVVAIGDVDKMERLEEIIYDGIFYQPNFAVRLYASMAQSEVKSVRELAATNMARVFKCDPEAGSLVWNQLLKDTDPEVAETAYLAFDEFCRDMEREHEHTWDMEHVVDQSPESSRSGAKT